MTRSEQLFASALELIPGGVNSPVRAFRSVGGTPFFTESANGCRLRTVDGVELIDYVLTWGPAIHGHNDPEIREAVIAAAARGVGFGTPGPDEVAMAALVKSCFPKSIAKVRMTNSGTEATMSSLRLARGFTGRHKIVKFSGCFHGAVDSLLIKAGSGALTFGNPDSAGVTPGVAQDTVVLTFNDVAGLEAAFAEHGALIAGVILEPYLGNVGLIAPLPGFLGKLRELCTKHGALLIFDEVMTGFRLSLSGAQGLTDVVPDIVCLGKIIGGGLPVGAFGGRADIMDKLAPLGPVYQAGTNSGNPLSMAAGLAAVEKLKRTNPYADLDKKAATLRAAILDAAKKKGLAVQVPQVGSMFSFYFSETRVDNYAQALASDGAQFKKVFRYALDHGVFLPPSPYEAGFLSTAHDDAAIAKTCEVLAAGIAAL